LSDEVEERRDLGVSVSISAADLPLIDPVEERREPFFAAVRGAVACHIWLANIGLPASPLGLDLGVIEAYIVCIISCHGCLGRDDLVNI